MPAEQARRVSDYHDVRYWWLLRIALIGVMHRAANLRMRSGQEMQPWQQRSCGTPFPTLLTPPQTHRRPFFVAAKQQRIYVSVQTPLLATLPDIHDVPSQLLIGHRSVRKKILP